MPIDDGAPSRATLLWTAQRILDQHAEGPDPDRVTGRCAQCREDGCSQLEWANRALPELTGVRVAS